MDNDLPPLRQPRVTPEQLPEFNAMINRLFGNHVAPEVRQQHDRELARLNREYRGEPEPLPLEFMERLVVTLRDVPLARQALRATLEEQ